MDTKSRALLWEEMRTGGVIAAWCLVVGILNMIWLAVVVGEDTSWHHMEDTVIFCTLGIPLMTVLLLLFRTGNSGHLKGGFSSRILLLPIETWRAVGLILIARCFLVLAISASMFVACWLAFGHGPAWVCVFAIGIIYLVAQTFDWLRRPAPRLAYTAIAACVVLFALAVLSEIPATLELEGFAVSDDLITLAQDVAPPGWLGPVLLLMGGVACFFIGLSATNLSRRNKRLHGAIRTSWLPEAVPLPGWVGGNGFSSPRWAMVWWQLRRNALRLPLSVGGVFLMFMLFVPVVKFFGEKERTAEIFGQLYWEWGPWVILLFGAAAWGASRGGVALQRGVRPSLTEFLFPMTAADMCTARLWANGFALVVTWLGALLISQGAFLFGANALAWRIYGESMAAGETSLREFVAAMLNLPLLFLLIAWTLTALRTRLLAWLVGGTFFLMVLQGMFKGAADGDDWLEACFLLAVAVLVSLGVSVWAQRRKKAHWGHVFGVAMVLVLAVIQVNSQRYISQTIPWLLVSLVIVTTAAPLLWLWRRKVMPIRHLVAALSAWAAVALFFCPYEQANIYTLKSWTVMAALALGALAVLPYPALLLDLHRRRCNADAMGDEAQHARPALWNLNPVVRMILAATLVGGAFFGGWLHWPAKPVYIEALRAQGEPATLVDLAEEYATLPASENAALQYLGAVLEMRTREADWKAWLQEEYGEKETLDGADWQDLNDKLVIQGNAQVDRRDLIPADVWELSRARAAQVSQPISAILSEIAAQNYAQSRYPLNLGAGSNVDTHHLAAVRSLARALSLSAWVASVEDRPADIVGLIQAMGPVGESLKEEPTLISQLVRVAIHGITVAALENAMNRTQFSEEELAELQNFFATALPPKSEHSIVGQGMRGEKVMASTPFYELYPQYRSRTFNTDTWGYRLFWAFNRVALLRCHAELNAQNHVETATLPRGKMRYSSPLLTEIEDAGSTRYIMVQMLMPALERAYLAEWRDRCYMDMAVAACAVERYRLKQGRLPETLDALVPEFLDAVPVDPFNENAPITYRVREDGEFVIYTWAMNGMDDQGTPLEKGSGWHSADFTFTVAPPDIRNRPQIAAAVVEGRDVLPRVLEESGKPNEPNETSGRAGVRPSRNSAPSTSSGSDGEKPTRRRGRRGGRR
jgi:hypothetical protein